MKPVPHGEPYAGNLHVRFDEGAGVPDNKGRSALLYSPRPSEMSLSEGASHSHLRGLVRRVKLGWTNRMKGVCTVKKSTYS